MDTHRFTTKHAPWRLAGLIGVATLLAGCDGRAPGPTAPGPTSPSLTGPIVTFTLSGAVAELTASGPVPIGGAQVTDMGSGAAAVTDESGLYSLPGLTATRHELSITRSGYVTASNTVHISGDTRLDVRLERKEGYTLSGVVFELTAAGPVPIEGAEVYCDSCGSPDGHTSVYTDATGFYSLAWAMNGAHPLFVTKAGYDMVNPTATVRGDTRFDVRLVKR